DALPISFIPSMALEALIRRTLDGRKPASGARSAIQELELEDYDTLFQKRAISTGFRNMTPMPEQAPLYQKILGDAWHRLPDPIRKMHELSGIKTVSGMATVERGTSLPSRA